MRTDELDDLSQIMGLATNNPMIQQKMRSEALTSAVAWAAMNAPGGVPSDAILGVAQSFYKWIVQGKHL